MVARARAQPEAKDPLSMSWAELNAFLMATDDVELLESLEARERAGKRRGQYVSRIRSRRNRCRLRREREEMDL